MVTLLFLIALVEVDLTINIHGIDYQRVEEILLLD